MKACKHISHVNAVFFPTPTENRLDLKRTARNLKKNSCNVFIRGGELWPDLGLAERLFSKTMAKSRAVKTMIGLDTRFGSCLTEGISDNTKLSTTKTNGLLNNEQNPARRKLNFLYTQPGPWSDKNYGWGNVHGRETNERKKHCTEASGSVCLILATVWQPHLPSPKL